MYYSRKIIFTIALLFPFVLVAQDLAKFNWKNPVKINGGFNATNTFYQAWGMPARRAPWFWMLSGNANIQLFGIVNVPVSAQISALNKNYTQPYNQVGFSPTYKAWTVHAGYRSLQYSPYTVGGTQWLGGAIEYTPESSPYFASVLYGRFQKSVTQESTDQFNFGTPAYERWGYATRFGYQKKGKAVAVVLFRGKDNPFSVPDSVAEKANIRPGENFVCALTTRQKLTKTFTFDLEYALSAYTVDSRIIQSDLDTYRYANHLGSLLRTNTSTQVNRAIQGNLTYSRPAYQLKFGYRRIDPEYKTMGSMFLNNDIEDISAGVNWQMFRQKMSASITGGLQRNNLDKKLTQEVVRNAFAASLTYAVNQKLNLNANYSNFLSNTRFNNLNVTANQLNLQQNSDSIRYNQVMQNAGLNANYQFGDSIIRHGLFANTNWQRARDSRDNNSDFYSGMAGYSINYVKLQLGFNIGILSTFNTTAGFFNQMIGPTLGANKVIKKIWRLAWNSSYTTTYTDHTNSGYNFSHRLMAGVKRGKHHTVNADVNWLQRKMNTTNTPKSDEFRFNITYGYVF